MNHQRNRVVAHPSIVKVSTERRPAGWMDGSSSSNKPASRTAVA
jgi:hypothetical protein